MVNKLIINIHSLVDLITNSSTELFCYVKGKTGDQVREIIKVILEEFECEAVDFYVDDEVWLWDDVKGEEYLDEGKVSISWDYEIHHPPCGMIIKRLKEIFGINGEYPND